MDFLFSFSGRIGRAKWWLSQLAVVMIWVIVIGAFALFVQTVDPSAEHAEGELSNGGLSTLIALLSAIVLSTWINLAGTVKRFHDRDKSGFWFLITLIPFIGPIWLIVECGVLEGTRGGNRFGPPPGGMDGFADELEAHIAKMQAERMPRQGTAPAARTSAPVPVAQLSSRRPTSPGGFGRRGT